jgi:aminodeoxyfutalosine deaminase
MSIRKITGSRLFDGYRFREGMMLVLNEYSEVIDLVTDDGSAERFEGLLMPGMVNCHCHLELSHMKGKIPEGTGLVDFVLKVVSERHCPEEEIMAAIAMAEAEMKQNGIVAVGDICNNASTLTQKSASNLYYYNFIEASGWLPDVAEQRFKRAQELLEAFDTLSGYPTPNPPLQKPNSIVPHAPYSVSPALWEKLQPHFYQKAVSIHNQETAGENEFFQQGTGDFRRLYQLMRIDNGHHQPTQKTSLQSYIHWLQKAHSVLLVHNTYTTQADLDFLQSSGYGQESHIYFCLCPNANQYIEKALPPVQLFRDNQCRMVLGTDSLASNHQLSILEEIKTLQQHFPSIGLEEMLGWATINGAKALMMDETLGSFEKGKKPGVVLIEPTNLQVKQVIA